MSEHLQMSIKEVHLSPSTSLTNVTSQVVSGYLAFSISESTKKSYLLKYTLFQKICKELTWDDSREFSEEELVLIAHKAVTTYGYSADKLPNFWCAVNYFYAVNTGTDLNRGVIFSRAMKGISKSALKVDKASRQAEAFDWNSFHLLFKTCMGVIDGAPDMDVLGYSLWALMSTGFFAMLRIGEMLKLKFSDLEFFTGEIPLA